MSTFIKIIIMNLKILVFLALFISGNAFAQKNKDEWEYPFNGKDLIGWKVLGGKATYEAKNNEIVGTTVTGIGNSFLTTSKEYGDFIMELELMVHPLMNSGIQIRSLSSAEYQNGRVHGYQIEIDPSTRAWSGGVYDEGRRGWLYNLEVNPDAKAAFKNNEWNKYRIECIGNTIRTWVNGVPVAHLVDSETAKGFIALQVHAIPASETPGRQVKWRNIRIQTQNLKASPLDNIYVVNNVPNTISPQEKKLGYRLLWDGKSTKGWTAANKDHFPENGWSIKDGNLTVIKDEAGKSSEGGDITSVKEFSAFELKFDFKMTEGANSGLKYFVKTINGSALGLEYQILDDERHPDAKQGINGNRTLGSLYDLIAANKPKAYMRKMGEWNQGVVKVFPDNRVEHWLNGHKVVEYQRNSPEFRALIAKSKFKDIPGFGLAPKGKILLQDHGDEVSFRSIKVKELK